MRLRVSRTNVGSAAGRAAESAKRSRRSLTPKAVLRGGSPPRSSQIYQARRTPSCMLRIGAPRLVISPAVPVSTLFAGWPRIVWFRVLNTSQRAWRVNRSVRLNVLASDQSRLNSPGPAASPDQLFREYTAPVRHMPPD